MIQGNIVLFQIGKVGSTTIGESLRASGIDVEHAHVMLPESVARRSKGEQRAGSPAYDKAARLLKLMWSGAQVNVITSVREPIGRNVSLLFETYSALTGGSKWQDATQDELQRVYEDDLPHDEPLVWFDDEFLPATGVDVYAHEFDAERGWSVVARGSVRVLLIKVEIGDAALGDAISRFLGSKVIIKDACRVNKHRVYEAFKRRVLVPQRRMEEAVASKYVRHFYTEREITAMRVKWRVPAA